MKRVVSFFCACAMSIMGSLICDLKMDINTEDNKASISVDDKIEIVGNTYDSYIEEYDTKTNSNSEDVEEINQDESISKKISISSYIPSSYKDKKYTTSAKDQGKYSTCWGFSTISSIESNLIKKGLVSNKVNLSEAGLVYFTYNKANNDTKDTIKNVSGKNYLYVGGNKTITMYALASGTCLVNESIMPYSKITPNIKYSDAYGYYSDYMVRDIGFIQANNRNDIKNAIYKYGAINAALYQLDSNKYYNSKYNSYYQNSITDVNHAIAIVGWDDNYSKNNFNLTPSKNGAWLVKNSWGSSWGDDGYFWVSYYDKSLNYSGNNVAYYDMEKKNRDFLNLYEHDGTYSTASLYDVRYHSNVYTCKQNEMISDVLFYTNENNVSYELSIYTGVEDIPTEGELAYVQKGNIKYLGCHTIKLNKGVNIKRGTKYSVVISLANEEGETTPVSVDDSVTYPGWLQFNAVANKGESFYKTDNGSWTDLGLSMDANCRIKVFTKKGYNVTLQKNASKNVYNMKVNNIGNSSIDVKYVIYNKTTDSTEIFDYNKHNTSYEWEPSEEGKYQIQTYIKDKTTGYGYVFTNEEIVSTLVGYIPVVTTKINNLGIVVTAKTKSSKDGTGKCNYYYRVFDSKNRVVRTKPWCKSNVYNFYAPGSGNYLLRCYIKDETGMIVKKDKVLQFKDIKINSLIASKTKVSKGTNVKIKVKATDGIGKLKYYLRVFKEENSKRVFVHNSASYTYDNNFTWKPLREGTYYFKVYVKDTKGNIKNKEIKYIITDKDI